MGLNTIFEQLADITKTYFNKAGNLYIKRITTYVPENVSEWPWMYFVPDDGDIDLHTFKSDQAKISNVRTFGAVPQTAEISRRPLQRYVHHFNAQLLVKPRTYTKEDEPETKIFIEPFATLVAQNINLDNCVEYCRVTGYTYGVLSLGVFSGKPVDFIGLNFSMECAEVI